MNKAQEKIMKGMAKQLAQFDGQDWDALSLEAQGTYKGRAIVLGCHLHSQGVVIKVDRELPDKPLADDWAEAIKAPRNAFYELAQKDMLKAGYVAVEPLVKEG